MAVDRGGLQYGITVTDGFSDVTANFRRELVLARKAFRDFQRDLSLTSGNAKGLKDAAKAARDNAAATRESAKAAREGNAVGSEQLRFAAKRARAIRNLADASRLAADAQVREVRETLASARAEEKSASAAGRAAAAKRRATEATKAQAAAERAASRQLNQNIRNIQASQARQANIERERLALRRVNAAEEVAIQRQRARQVDDTLRAIEAGQVRQRQIEQARIRGRAANERERSRRPEIIAQRQLAREVTRERIEREKIAQLRTQARQQFRGGDILGGADTVRRARQIERSIKQSARSGNSLLFTFRRLVGTLAVFTLARELTSGFANLVRLGIGFNDQIAASEIGIAGLVATLGDVRNSFGESVDSAQELDLALGLARQQIRALRQDSLRTTATFEELLDTFQVAIGPGLAAGLNLDEVRQLTVQISQAATALGVPQNQLAEEIRSLLQGTIQARTTRIATALGITNADIRRLQETGELFDFLEQRLQGFSEAAQRAARQTLSGISTLIRGALGELLGQAAQPLFDELLGTANQLFDEVLTVRDEFDNIRPNPDVVKAFGSIFDALRQGVVAARELGMELGFDGLQDVLATFGAGLVTAIELGIGAVEGLVVGFRLLIAPVKFIAELLGIGNKELGAAAGFTGFWLVTLLSVNKVLSILGLSLKGIVSSILLGDKGFSLWARSALKARAATLATLAPIAGVAAGIGVVIAGINALTSGVTRVNVTLGDTVKLIALGLVQAFIEVATVVAKLGARIGDLGAQAVSGGASAARELKDLVAFQFASTKERIALEAASSARARAEAEAKAARERKLAFVVAAVEGEGARRVEAIQKRIAKILNDRDLKNRNEKASAFDPSAFDPKNPDFNAGLGKATDEFGQFNGIVSTADKSLAALAGELLKLTDGLRQARAEFAQGVTVDGPAGRIQRIFDEAELASAERLRKVTQDILKNRKELNNLLETQQVAPQRAREIFQANQVVDPAERERLINALQLNKAEGKFNSLLRDRTDLMDGAAVAEQLALDGATARAAVQAQQILPDIDRENAQLAAQEKAARAINRAREARLPVDQQALIAAQTQLDILREEGRLAREIAAAALVQAQIDVNAAPPGEQRDALQALLTGLQDRAAIETAITREKERQAELDIEEADRVANGSVADGLSRGFENFGNQFASRFQAGIAIATNLLNQFTTFAAQEIVNAFDPTANGGEDRIARFFQSLARQILTTLIQNAIAVGIQRLIGKTQEAAIEQTASATASSTRIQGAVAAGKIELAFAKASVLARSVVGGGAHSGGIVPAKGFRSGIGSIPRPRGISAFDTVPAFLQPGEAVIRKSVVDAAGADTFARINNGNLGLAQGLAEGGATGGGAVGSFREGTLVADTIGDAQRISGSSDALEEGVGMVPVLIAGDRQAERFTSGGRNAMLAWARENAGTLSSILDRGQSRR